MPLRSPYSSGSKTPTTGARNPAFQYDENIDEVDDELDDNEDEVFDDDHSDNSKQSPHQQDVVSTTLSVPSSGKNPTSSTGSSTTSDGSTFPESANYQKSPILEKLENSFNYVKKNSTEVATNLRRRSVNSSRLPSGKDDDWDYIALGTPTSKQPPSNSTLSDNDSQSSQSGHQNFGFNMKSDTKSGRLDEDCDGPPSTPSILTGTTMSRKKRTMLTESRGHWQGDVWVIHDIPGRQGMAHFDCLERPLSLFFCKYGRFVAQHPIPFVVFPLLVSMMLSFGLLHFNMVTDAVFLFTPTDAPSKYERQVIHDKWPVYEDNYIPGRSVTQSRECQVIVRARHGANILKDPYAKAVERLNNFIAQQIEVHYSNSSDIPTKRYGYEDLCLRWRQNHCAPNFQMALINSLFRIDENITFPKHRFGFGTVYLASSMGDVKLRPADPSYMAISGNDTTLSTSATANKHVFYINSARTWMLLFQLKFQDVQSNYISGIWEKEFERQMLEYVDPYIELTFFHSQTLTEELKRNADTLVPKFVISFTILITFACCCTVSMVGYTPFVDWVVSKPALALCGVCNAGMGVLSAIGLLNFCGLYYNQIVNVMPFLVVSIGVDNMFLMLASFRRTDRSLPNDKRVGECMAESAISITITALTDALSFGIGAITTIPAVQIFCVYTGVAIAVTFIYQMTFYVGLMALYGRSEAAGRHHCTFMQTTPAEKIKSSTLLTKLFNLGTHAPPPGSLNTSSDESFSSKFFRDWYGYVLMEPIVKIIVLIWFAVYLGFAIFGCLQIREGLEPVNLLVSDSYAIPHYRWLETYFWKYGGEVQIVVNKVPDLMQLAERDKLKSMVNAFANTEHTIGLQSVQWWMYELEEWVVNVEKMPLSYMNNNENFYSFARDFFTRNEKQMNDVRWNDTNKLDFITAFRFIVGMRDFETTNQQRDTTQLLRNVSMRYQKDYNITTFMPLWLFTDQYSLILPNTLQNIGIAMACMIVIALLLIPQPICALWVAIAIASIDTGVIGYMTLWDVKLDAISMITIIMSIGFSVDFSAHITYGYVVSTEQTPSDRVRVALASLGMPILQGAASTILGVLALCTVKAYMIVTFFKTVFLVIAIGALHGLVFLPVLLAVFVRGFGSGSSVKPVQDESSKLGSPSKRKELNQSTPASGRIYHVRDLKRRGALN